MNVLTPSSFFSFYPDLTCAYQCLVRHAIGTPLQHFWDVVDDALEKGYVVAVHNANERTPCDECPGRRRRTCGMEGVFSFVWNDEFFKETVDEYVEVMATAFQSPHANFLYQFSAQCYNPACYFGGASIFHHDTGLFTTSPLAFHGSMLPVPTDDSTADEEGAYLDDDDDDDDDQMQCKVLCSRPFGCFLIGRILVPWGDDDVADMCTRILALPVSTIGPQYRTAFCYFFGPECSVPHVVPVPAVAGTTFPFTPDHLHIGSWLLRHRQSRSGVFDNGMRRFTDDFEYEDGTVASFTMYWEPSPDTGSINGPIRDLMLKDAPRVRTWRGAAMMVKHVGLQITDIGFDDELAARSVLAK